MPDQSQPDQDQPDSKDAPPAAIEKQQLAASGGNQKKPANGKTDPADGEERPTYKSLWREIRVIDVVNCLVGIAMFVVAIATYRVAGDTSDVKSAVRNISTLATQTKRQADDADQTINAVIAQLDVARKEERAWLVVKPKDPLNNAKTFSVVVGKVPYADFYVTNVGKTPAHNYVVRTYFEIVQNGEAPHFESDEVSGNQDTSGIFPPSDTNPLPIFLIDGLHLDGETLQGNKGTNLTANDMKSLKRGDSWIAAHGIVTYFDVFNISHWVRFCGWTGFKKGATFSAKSCTDYNGSDLQ